MKEEDILFEIGRHWICRAKYGKGFEVYRNTITHAERHGVFAIEGDVGFEMAKAHCLRRESIEN